MKLELTKAELDLTIDVLQNRMGELRQEIYHTTVSHFKDQLKEMEVLLQGIIDKLESASTAPPH
jgi:hypothetical protein